MVPVDTSDEEVARERSSVWSPIPSDGVGERGEWHENREREDKRAADRMFIEEGGETSLL